MHRTTTLLAASITLVSLSGPASAWMHANRWGGFTAHDWGSTTRTDAWGGSMTHTWGEGTTATNRWGDTATHAEGSRQTTFTNPWGGSATHTYGEGTTWEGRYGGTAHTDAYGYHPYGYYGGAYRPYYPPAAVDTYAAGCPNCAWGAAAAGAAVGLAAGAAAGAASADAAIGTSYATLPAGCVSPGGMDVIYRCEGFWVKPVYGANGVHYQVVPPP